MDDHIIVRDAGPDDADLLATAGKAVFRDGPKPDLIAAFLAGEGQLMAVGITMGQVIGVAYGAAVRHPDRAPTLVIQQVRVVELWRRHEIGTRLVRNLLTRARKLGCEGILAATSSGNWNSNQLFRKLGGRQTHGMTVFDWDDIRLD